MRDFTHDVIRTGHGSNATTAALIAKSDGQGRPQTLRNVSQLSTVDHVGLNSLSRRRATPAIPSETALMSRLFASLMLSDGEVPVD